MTSMFNTNINTFMNGHSEFYKLREIYTLGLTFSILIHKAAKWCSDCDRDFYFVIEGKDSLLIKSDTKKLY